MELSTYIWIFLSYFGDIAYWLGFMVSFLLIYYLLDKKERKKLRWILYYLLPSVLISYASSFFLKMIFKIPRVCAGLEYCPQTYAFPSGHAAIMSAFFLTTFLWFRKRPEIYMPALIISILVCYSRIALNVHTIFDIVGGIILGGSISLIWHAFFRRIESRKYKYNFYFRKLIHLAGVLIILLKLTVERSYVIAIMLTITLMFLISEILRIRKIYVPIFHEISACCMKREEKGLLIEPLLFALSLTILSFLPTDLFLIGSIPLVISDGIAGLFGYRFGKHRLIYNKSKTVEGSLSFFISSFISLLFFFDIKISIIMSLFSTILESVLRKYENLLLPILCVIFYSLVSI